MGQSDENLLWTLTIFSSLLFEWTPEISNEQLEAYEIKLDLKFPDSDLK